MQLGVALLWLGRYGSAWEHFRSTIIANSRAGDNDYGMAGVAKWCIGEPSEAVSEWRSGLGAGYARAAGLGIRMPLLLFFAAVLKPSIVDRDEVTKLLLERLADPRIRTWPGPIAKLVVGKIGKEDLEEICYYSSRGDARDRLWLSQFYIKLLSYNQSRVSDFKKSMRSLADTDEPEPLNEDSFLTRIWSEEFFLARHEGESGR